MAEELNNTPVEDESAQATQAIETEAISEVQDAVEEATTPLEEVLETATEAIEVDAPAQEEAGDPTVLIELPTQEDAPAAMPTESLGALTEEIPVPANPTTPMPNPFSAPQDTTPFPTPDPTPTTAGFDVPLGPVDLEGPTPTAPASPFASANGPEPANPVAPENPVASNNPYASAVVAAAPAAAAIPPAAPAYTAAARQVSPGPGTYAQPDYQQSYQQPTYAQPTYAQSGYQNAVPHQPFAPDPTVPNPYEYSLTSLTGGMKFGWFLIGLFLTVPGMLLAWLVNADKHPQVKKDAITWSVIGFAVDVVLGILFSVAFASLLAAAISASGGYYGNPF